MEAEITLKYEKTKTAETVAKAVSPDNLETPKGLSIRTIQKKNIIVTRISCEKLPTFIFTIDDLLFSTSIAEKMLRLKNFK